MTREGSLEAPTRHPLDWRNPDFYDEASLDAELERVFDICHTCRRCVSLCGAFPTLFDLIDESKTGELDSVPKSEFGKVVDQCYLCDVCFMTKCPYVPPHPWNVDFPHLMLRAKARKFENDGARFRDRLLTSTDRVGTLATIPVVVQMVNAASTTRALRKIGEKVLGIAAAARLPPYAEQRFLAHPEPSLAWPVRNGERTPGKVAVFATCYVNFNEPGIGHDLLKLLAHNEIPYRVVAKEACCGMPKLELGDLPAVERLKDVNIPQLAALAREGYAIVTPVPSCTLMYKQELPLLFPGDPEVAAVAEAMFDPFEYLVLRDRDGLLKKEFAQPLGRVSYHIPCHCARAERRPEDAGSAAMGAGHRSEHGRTLRRPRRHIWREGGIFCRIDEDRQAGLCQNERQRPRFHQFRLPDRQPADHAGHRRAGRAAARPPRASADAAAHCLRIGVTDARHPARQPDDA